MGFPYAIDRVLRGEEGFINVPGKNPKDKMNWLMESGNMMGKYLGACLDSCRWGGHTTVMWETDVRGLMKFIQNWRKQNRDDEILYHEVSIEKYWKKFELPHINHKKCPRDEKHKGTLVDRLGIVRCNNVKKKLLRPSFIVEYDTGFDKLSRCNRMNFYEDEPHDPSYEDDYGEIVISDEYPEYLTLEEKWDEEEKTAEIIDPCYAIISDKNIILPFETILKRFNLEPEYRIVYCPRNSTFPDFEPCKKLKKLTKEERADAKLVGHCPGHYEPTKKVVFPFDGWELAHYLMKWKHQLPDNKAPWFSVKREECILNQEDYAWDD